MKGEPMEQRFFFSLPISGPGGTARPGDFYPEAAASLMPEREMDDLCPRENSSAVWKWHRHNNLRD